MCHYPGDPRSNLVIRYQKEHLIHPRCMHAKTEDYIFVICAIWIIMVGFFIIVTREVMLLIGLAFPLLIIMLIRGGNKRTYSLVL